MAELAKVLIVDDDRTWQMVLTSSLKEGYITSATADSENATALIAEDFFL